MVLRRTRNNTSSKKMSQEQPTSEISKLAYQYYVDRGYQNGNELEDWLRAERVVMSSYNRGKK